METFLALTAATSAGRTISIFRIYKIRKTMKIISDIRKFNLNTITDNPVSLIAILLIVITRRHDNPS